MLQAVMTSPGEIVFREVPDPVAGPGQVLLRMVRIGVCGSDIHVWHGKHPYTSYPVVQGHEVSAEVLGIGPGVAGFAPGDRVTVMPQVVCGECLACRSGRYHICDRLKVMGFQTTGMASERVAVDAAKVLRLPDGMGFDEGAMIEPLAVAVHALRRAGDVAGKKVLVLGAGPIGNLVAQAAKGTGAAAVLVTDLSAFRLSVARACGVDATVDAGRESLPEALEAAFGPDRADVVLECVGAEATVGQAVSLARKGSDIVVVGVFGALPKVDLGLVQDRELRLIGTLMYQETDYREAIRLAAEGRVRLAPLLSAHFPFREYRKAYEAIETEKDRILKAMIDVT